MSAVYKHYSLETPLSPSTHIRLIILRPSPVKSAPLECQVVVFPINGTPPYIALSYTWGEGKFENSLIVQPENEVVSITPGLDECLRYIRDATETQTLWIDQICINQAQDAYEKEPQVGLMRQIYPNAERILAWLGPANDTSDELMDNWEQVGLRAQEHDIGFPDDAETFRDAWIHAKTAMLSAIMAAQMVALGLHPPDAVNTLPLVALCRDAWPRFRGRKEEIKQFFELEWFRRIWIVQEVALAKKVILRRGDKQLDAYVLYAGMMISWICSIFSSDFAPTMESLKELMKLINDVRTTPLAELIGVRNKAQFGLHRSRDAEWQRALPLSHYLEYLHVSARKFSVTNARDRIYGLLGLEAHLEHLDITPDYKLSEEEVYTQAARAILERGTARGQPTTQLLNLCRPPRDNNLSSLPSWVVDWRANVRPSFCGAHHHELDPHYFAAGGPADTTLPDIVKPDPPNDKVIGLKGCLFDEIQKVGSPWDLLPQFPADFDQPRRPPETVDVLAFFEQVQKLCADAVIKRREAGWPNVLVERLGEEASWNLPCGALAATGPDGKVMRAGDGWRNAYDLYVTQCRWLKDRYDANLELDRGGTKEDIIKWRQRWVGRLEAYNGTLGQENMNLGNAYRKMMAELKDMRPFLTKGGFVGMAPLAAMAGDKVVVFVGAELPFIIKPMQNGTYRLLGEAYCHMIMNGEALTMEKVDIFLV